MIIVSKAEFVSSFTRLDRAITNAPHLAFAGKSNVGKSSLINFLCNAKVAKVSQKPGKTTLLNVYNISLKNTVDNFEKKLFFIDLPGFGYAKLSKEEIDTISKRLNFFIKHDLKRCWHILDCRRKLTGADFELSQLLQNSTEGEYTIVLSKCDKLSKNQLLSAQKSIANSLSLQKEDIHFCSVEDQNTKTALLQTIWEKI